MKKIVASGLALLLAGWVAGCGDRTGREGERVESQGISVPATDPDPAAEENSENSPHAEEDTNSANSATGEENSEEASETGAEPEPDRGLIAIDTHIDTTQRMLDADADLAERLRNGHVDLPRMREGGLSGAFFSIWVDPRKNPGEKAWERTQALIGAVTRLVRAHPDQVALCTTAEEVRAAHRAGKIAALMGIEGAHALGEGDPELLLRRLAQVYRQGVRYMTVTWSNDNVFAHSSGGPHPTEGLTELGRRLIPEMNRLGMIVDISHVSDRTFWDVMEIARRPVLASHSSARALSNHPRNMSDAMIRRVGENGGAVCLNYYTAFLDADYGRAREEVMHAHREELAALRRAHAHSWDRHPEENRRIREWAPELHRPTLRTLGAHFAHVAAIAGQATPCLGSDFDGVGELPRGLEDASDLGALREELSRRELDVRAVLGENVLRVLAAQEGPLP